MYTRTEKVILYVVGAAMAAGLGYLGFVILKSVSNIFSPIS